MSALAVVPPMSAPAAPPAPGLSIGERVRAVVVAPLWFVCAAGWGLTSATLLTWHAGREMPWLER